MMMKNLVGLYANIPAFMAFLAKNPKFFKKLTKKILVFKKKSVYLHRDKEIIPTDPAGSGNKKRKDNESSNVQQDCKSKV